MNMIVLGIYTEQNTALKIKKWIQNEWKDRLKFDFCLYDSESQMLKVLRDNAGLPDIIICDACSHERPGDVKETELSVVKKIREYNSTIDIIAVIDGKELISGGLLYKMYGCIKCPVKWEDLKPIMSDYLQSAIKESNTYTVIFNREPYTINLDDISYFESRKRIIYPHGKYQNIRFYKKLEDLENELSDRGFVRCHRSFVVNAKYVEEVHREYLVVGGEMVSVGREYYEQSDGGIWCSLKKWNKYGSIIGVGSMYDGVLFRTKPEAEIVFGSDARYADIVINDDKVGEKQGILIFHQQDKTYTLSNVGDAAIVVNGAHKIYTGEAIIVKNDDCFWVDDSLQKFKLG